MQRSCHFTGLLAGQAQTAIFCSTGSSLTALIDWAVKNLPKKIEDSAVC